MEKFILPVRSDICREIRKRGTISHRQDETGQVKKRTNPNGTTSPLGWGAVKDTFFLNPVRISAFFRNVDLLVKQIEIRKVMPPKQYSDSQKTFLGIPQKTKRPLQDEESDLNPRATKSSRIAPLLLQEWYQECLHHKESGSIGLLPEFWRDEKAHIPPLEEMMETPLGKGLQNFAQYLRRNL